MSDILHCAEEIKAISQGLVENAVQGVTESQTRLSLNNNHHHLILWEPD